jgi:hypothetical protein
MILPAKKYQIYLIFVNRDGSARRKAMRGRGESYSDVIVRLEKRDGGEE